jgi:hypothetical protein
VTPDPTVSPTLSLIPNQHVPYTRYAIDTGFMRIHLVDRIGDTVALCGMRLHPTEIRRHPVDPRPGAVFHYDCMTTLHALALIEYSRREQDRDRQALRRAADAIASDALIEWVETDLTQSALPAYRAHPDTGATLTPGWVVLPSHRGDLVKVRWIPHSDQGRSDCHTEQTAGLATITAALAVRGWDNSGPVSDADNLYAWVYRRRVA